VIVREKSEEERMQEFRSFLNTSEGIVAAASSLSVADLQGMAVGEEVEDVMFAAFKERIKSDPKQVIRVL